MTGISRYEKIALGVTAAFVLFCVLLLAGYARGGGNSVPVVHAAPTQVQSEEQTIPDSLIPGERINLNTAPAVELRRLPGIGEKKAADIVAFREENGPFQSVEELMRVAGIGEVTLNALRDYITVNEE